MSWEVQKQLQKLCAAEEILDGGLEGLLPEAFANLMSNLQISPKDFEHLKRQYADPKEEGPQED